MSDLCTCTTSVHHIHLSTTTVHLDYKTEKRNSLDYINETLLTDYY